jgi:hypothetical protein
MSAIRRGERGIEQQIFVGSGRRVKARFFCLARWDADWQLSTNTGCGR